MKRFVVLLAITGAAVLPSTALGIVHGTTPIRCVGAVAHSGGSAGGFAALDEQIANPAPGPPMPARGLEHAGDDACP